MRVWIRFSASLTTTHQGFILTLSCSMPPINSFFWISTINLVSPLGVPRLPNPFHTFYLPHCNHSSLISSVVYDCGQNSAPILAVLIRVFEGFEKGATRRQEISAIIPYHLKSLSLRYLAINDQFSPYSFKTNTKDK